MHKYVEHVVAHMQLGGTEVVQSVKIGAACGIHGDNFTIEYGGVGQVFECFRYGPELAIEDVATPGIERCLSGILHDFQSVAVQLYGLHDCMDLTRVTY